MPLSLPQYQATSTKIRHVSEKGQIHQRIFYSGCEELRGLAGKAGLLDVLVAETDADNGRGGVFLTLVDHQAAANPDAPQ